MQKCMCVSMNICCVKLTEKFGSQIKRYYQTPPGGYIQKRLLSPGLLLEVTCLNLENHFWRPKGLAIKFRKSLEVKNLKFRIFKCWSVPYLWLKACYSINLSENQIWVLISTEAYHTNQKVPLKIALGQAIAQNVVKTCLLEYQNGNLP